MDSQSEAVIPQETATSRFVTGAWGAHTSSLNSNRISSQVGTQICLVSPNSDLSAQDVFLHVPQKSNLAIDVLLTHHIFHQTSISVVQEQKEESI